MVLTRPEPPSRPRPVPTRVRLRPEQQPGARRSRRRGRTGRIVLVVVSALVVLASGAGWLSLHATSQANVVDAATANNAEQNILLVGLDTRTDAHGNPLPTDQLAALHAGSTSDGGDNTDTMIVVHVAAGGGAATAFSIPRDSYVELADGFGHHKINTAYTYGENTARPVLAARGLSGPALALAAGAAGAREAIGTVQDLTGLTITHYAAVNLAAFDAISNAVGGVRVCLNAAVHDDFSGAAFPAGVQTISGPAALAFVRQRHGLPHGDLDRIRRQQVFMAALSNKLLSAGTLTDPVALPAVVAAVQDNVVLDQNWNLVSFAEQLHRLSAGAVTFRTVPTGSNDLKTPTDGTAVAIDPAQVQAFIHAATDPAPSSPATPTPPPRAPQNGDGSVDSVEVLNGSTQAGAATAALDALVRDGFSPADTGDAAVRAATTIGYAPADRADAATAQAVLGPGTVLVADPRLSPGRLKITLGTDHTGAPAAFTGTGRRPGAGPPTPPPITAAAVPCID